MLHTKGALQSVLPLCARVAELDAVRPVDGALRERVLALENELAAGGLRVLAVAWRHVSPGEPIESLITWWPWEAAEWQLRVQVVDNDQRVLAERTQPLRVVETPLYNIPAIFGDSTGLRHRWPTFLLLPALALLLGLGLFLTRSASAGGREP